MTDIDTPGGRLVGGTTHPIDSATVLVVRDAPDGLEVVLLERHLRSDFAGGAYAFPGGKVDPQDRTLPAERWTGLDPARWRDRLGAVTDTDVLGLWVAAVRETFEEAGILLARHADGAPVDAEDLASSSFVEARRRLAARGEHWDWQPWLAEHDLVLDLGAVAPFSWWVTPHGMHKRFNARFFVAEAPAAQADALGHDEVEVTDSVWMRPADALAAAERGEAVIIFPTRKNLEALAAFGSAGEAVAAGWAGRTDLRRILPNLTVVDGGVRVRHPDGGEPSAI